MTRPCWPLTTESRSRARPAAPRTPWVHSVAGPTVEGDGSSSILLRPTHWRRASRQSARVNHDPFECSHGACSDQRHSPPHPPDANANRRCSRERRTWARLGVGCQGVAGRISGPACIESQSRLGPAPRSPQSPQAPKWSCSRGESLRFPWGVPSLRSPQCVATPLGGPVMHLGVVLSRSDQRWRIIAGWHVADRAHRVAGAGCR